MIKTKKISNTVLVSFEKNFGWDIEGGHSLKKELISKLTTPFSNVLINLDEVNEISNETIEALMVGHRLSKMNRGQISLYNVKIQVYKALRLAKVDHLFFICDEPKPFSQDILMA